MSGAGSVVGGGLSARVFTAWADMRASMRWVLARRPDETQILVMVLVSGLLVYLSILAQQTLAPAQAGADPAAMQVTLLSGLVFSTLFWMLLVYLAALFAHLLARLFGGKGSGADSRAAMAWCLLVVMPPALVATIAAMLATPYLPLVLTDMLKSLGFLAFVYAIGQCFAEAHGFRSGLVISSLVLVPILGAIAFTVLSGAGI